MLYCLVQDDLQPTILVFLQNRCAKLLQGIIFEEFVNLALQSCEYSCLNTLFAFNDLRIGVVAHLINFELEVVQLTFQINHFRFLVFVICLQLFY